MKYKQEDLDKKNRELEQARRDLRSVQEQLSEMDRKHGSVKASQ